MRISRILVAGIVGIGLVLEGSLTASAASFQPAAERDNPVAIIEQAAPYIVAETSDTHDLSITPDPTSVTVAVGPSDSVGEGVSFSVDYATSASSSAKGMTVLATDEPDVSAVVQPTTFGVRVLTTISSNESPWTYDYTFNVPDGTDLVRSELNYYLESGDEVLGQIQLPWAVDSRGKSVPTTYSWEHNRLSQHVDLSDPSIKYPVVADPAWGYTYSYTLNKSAATNKSRLKACFNCYFPVSGAPRAFPKPGQLLPLKVGPANFECKFKSEFTGTNYFGFQFDATKNHVDGYGSNIIFELRAVGGVNKLVVSAYIVNDSFGINNAAYRLGAQANWSQFAWNLNHTAIIT